MTRARALALVVAAASGLLLLDLWAPLASGARSTTPPTTRPIAPPPAALPQIPLESLAPLLVPDLAGAPELGPDLRLAVGGAAGDLEFRWWLRLGGSWRNVRDFAADPGMSFHSPVRQRVAVQVDVRRRGVAESPVTLRKHWLGEAWIGPAHETLLVDPVREPTFDVVPVGEEVRVRARLAPYTAAQRLRSRWSVDGAPVATESGWSGWPPTPWIAEGHGRHQLAVEVHDPVTDQLEVHPLGLVVVVDAPSVEGSLWRTLAGTEFHATRGELQARTIHRLLVVIDAVAVVGTDVTALERALGAAREGRTIGRSADGPLEVTERGLAGDDLVRVAADAAWIEVADGLLRIRLDRDHLPDWHELLGTWRDADPAVRHAIGLGYAVYGGWQHGSPAHGALLDPREAVGHCGATTELLGRLCQCAGLPVRGVTYDHLGAVHAVLQVDTSIPLLLDTSEGRIYRFDVDRLPDALPPVPVPMPGAHDLGVRLDHNLLRGETTVYVSPGFARSIPTSLQREGLRTIGL